MKLLKIKTLAASCLLVTTALVSPSTAFGLTLTSPSAPAAPSAPIAPVAPVEPTAPVNLLDESQNTPTGEAATNTATPSEEATTTSSPQATNTGNGADSTNTSEVDMTDETAVETVNNADVENNLEVDVNTGGNDANKNMGDGSITTGDATVGGSLVNDLNNTIVNLDDLCGGCDAGGGAANSGNGSGSNNTANSSSNSTVDLNNTNNLQLVNNEGIGANTGTNEADKNMGDGVITSGDADISFTTVNFGNNTGINLETVNFDIVDTRSEDLLLTWPTGSGSATGTGAANTGNGADSTNNAASTSNTDTTINNTNDLLLDNNVTIYADTGDNSADANMGVGVIDSGDANIANNIINFLNNNIVAGADWLLNTVNIYGDMSGDIVLPREADINSCGCAADTTALNSGNGADSTNDATATSNDSLLVNNLNNATINNNLNIDANTGGNSADKNMGDSSISTGNLDVNSNLVTVANTNTVGQGDTWWLVLVNNQGEWTGKIVGANDGDTIAASGLSFGVAPDGSIYALNSGNGSDSTNSASATASNSTTINNTNNATVNNNVNIVANTGNNSADKNMGGADIKTGDISVASNIVNFINNNFVGKKFVVTVVNIFGKFTGNIVPPDQPLRAIGGVNLPEVSLASDTPIVASAKTSSKSGAAGLLSSINGEKLGEALSQGGKILENAAITQAKDPVSKVINNASQNASSFLHLNWILMGVALLILAGYAFIARRRA